MGLVSAIGPLVIGVMVAFGWNMAASHQAAVTGADSGVTPAVGLTVEQAAAQAWASSTPFAVRGGASGGPGGLARASDGTRSAAHPRESGHHPASCGRVRSPHLMQARATFTFTCSPQRPGRPGLHYASEPRRLPQDTDATVRLRFRSLDRGSEGMVVAACSIECADCHIHTRAAASRRSR